MEDFYILWFEDNFTDFDDIILNLEQHCLVYNKNLIIQQYQYYPNDFDVKLFEGKYSLAFIDLNLANGQKGISIIDILRKKGAFIDILLYSNNPRELISLTEGANYVEGVFRHATLNGIEDKMKGVIDQVIYKEIMILKRAGLT